MDHRTDNGTRKVEEDLMVRVRALLTSRPSDHDSKRPTWTLEILCTVIAKELGVPLSLTHVWRVEKLTGARWGRPRPVVACPWRTHGTQPRIAEPQ